MTKEDIRELIFREILEYHPQLLKDYMAGNEGANFLYPRFRISLTEIFILYIDFVSLFRILCLFPDIT